jgi:hypothetical protein
MFGDANVEAPAEAHTQFQIFDVSDDELERAGANDQQKAVSTAFCSQWWLCPF